MRVKTFVDKLKDAMCEKESILCVGLDPQFKYIPEHIKRQANEKSVSGEKFEKVARAIIIYFRDIIKATASFAAVAKPQMAFYEAYGYWGFWAFTKILEICREYGLLIIEDAKRCDGGDTARIYADGHLGEVDCWDSKEEKIIKEPSFDVDAMTVVPWIGTSCLTPFIKTAKEYGKGIFVVTKTSFSPNSEIEQLITNSGRKVWEETALLVKHLGQGYQGENGINNIGVVMGATYPDDAVQMRNLLPDCFFLVPGYGAQGGGADGAIMGVRKDGLGVTVNSSRAINYAYYKGEFKCEPEDFAQAAALAAEFSRDDLNAALKRAGKLLW